MAGSVRHWHRAHRGYRSRVAPTNLTSQTDALGATLKRPVRIFDRRAVAREGTRSGRLTARFRMPLTAAAVVALLGGVLVDYPPWLWFATLALFGVAMVVYVRFGTPTSPMVDLTSPVRGRWEAVNSPTNKVPSHGTHAWAQTYALDLVNDPSDGSRPSFGWWPVIRRPTAFPGLVRRCTHPCLERSSALSGGPGTTGAATRHLGSPTSFSKASVSCSVLLACLVTTW